MIHEKTLGEAFAELDRAVQENCTHELDVRIDTMDGTFCMDCNMRIES